MIYDFSSRWIYSFWNILLPFCFEIIALFFTQKLIICYLHLFTCIIFFYLNYKAQMRIGQNIYLPIINEIADIKNCTLVGRKVVNYSLVTTKHKHSTENKYFTLSHIIICFHIIIVFIIVCIFITIVFCTMLLVTIV